MSIQTAYTSFSNFPQRSKLLEEKALGAICFIDNSSDSNAIEKIEMPAIQLHTSILDGLYGACEIWLSNASLGTEKALTNGYLGDISYRLNDDFLFGVITLPESVSSEIDGDISPLQFTTESAYRQIFALMDEMNYPYIYRFWNYMEDINGVSHGLERYRQFNVGRKAAFTACSNAVHIQLPAACALGVTDGPLSIAFLLGRQSPIAIENPRQISAYEYPEEYGPQTPSFSRATLLHSEQATLLFISGTASIVGHQTLHPTDVVAQTKETLINLEAVIAEANRTIGEIKFDLMDVFLRVYVRHAADLSLIKNEMQRHLGSAMNAVFIQADICRQELLLEIEATAKCITESSSS
ncbi:MAG TPA: hypothetical protein VES38_02210 [Methylotenera sp.]|nr:hypothetical protein [Methylotenera sp.]